MKGKLKIGLALGGGGARGTAHIGVLQVLHREKIPIHLISGTSAGAIVGAMYAATLDPQWIEKRYFEFLKSDLFKAIGVKHINREKQVSSSVIGQLGRLVKDRIVINIALSRKGVIDRGKLIRAMEYLLPVKDFSELKIPLKVIASDLNSGEELIYDSGDLVEAVTLSSSIPGYVTPYDNDGQIVVDGAITAPLPVNCLSNSGINFTIAVDIARRGMEILDDYNIMELLTRSEHLTIVKLTDELAKKADFVISPDVGSAHWSEFNRVQEFLENGRKAAENKIVEIKKELSDRKKIGYRLKHWIWKSL